MCGRKYALCSLLLVLLVPQFSMPSVLAQTKSGVATKSYISERSLFWEEDESFPHRGDLPVNVMDALLRDKSTAYARELRKEQPDADIHQFFRYTTVHLGPDNEVDYLVNGLFPLTGADCAWYWIVVVRDGRARVVLWTNGASVEILTHRSNGHADRKTQWLAASGWGEEQLYRFNGKRYLLRRKREITSKTEQ